ncbi:class I tRNA ligase family protein [Candidatus Carsonella ruddii]|uniref:Methionyl-tRNA synthetase n=1 Tax=Carsonella ruddii TaxID=114186 RepID=A0A1U9RRJ4_CARRU|nr:class I tRNA ligase family protein [Candidatus Carsonella ruddii]AQU89538.1 Diaminopimelate decarboxylase [Candidatus Carsonella ruddii]
MKNFLITTALPYINGIIHIGHIYELYISNMYFIIIKKYYNCKIFSGLDCHGLIKNNNLLKIDFLNKKKISFYNFNIIQKKTNTFINKRICNWFFILLSDDNKIFSKNTFRFFNKEKNFFIPDKYINIFCKICNFEMENFFCFNCLKINKFYIKSKINKKNIILKKINSIFLKNYIFKDWDISRYIKYNGFNIISKKNIFFYVWFDAILSYISNNLNFIKKKYCNFFFFQIIGKDIIFFHKLFCIILKFLKIYKYNLLVHGFIIFKNKISKSKIIKLKKISKNKLFFFFLINNKNYKEDIKYDYFLINNYYKKIFFNKILNLFFRIRKILNLYDNRIIDFYNNKKNHFYDFNFFKKKKLNNFYYKKIINILKLNKYINENKFWEKKNNFLIHFYYSKIIFIYIKNLNNLIEIINNKIITSKIYKNYKIFNLKKINEI